MSEDIKPRNPGFNHLRCSWDCDLHICDEIYNAEEGDICHLLFDGSEDLRLMREELIDEFIGLRKGQITDKMKRKAAQLQLEFEGTSVDGKMDINKVVEFGYSLASDVIEKGNS